MAARGRASARLCSRRAVRAGETFGRRKGRETRAQHGRETRAQHGRETRAQDGVRAGETFGRRKGRGRETRAQHGRGRETRANGAPNSVGRPAPSKAWAGCWPRLRLQAASVPRCTLTTFPTSGSTVRFR